MSITIQTMITNKLGQTRKMPFLGNKGLFVNGNQSIIIEGAYPASCKNDAQRKAMTYEFETGLIDIVLITSLKVMSPIAKAGSVPVAAAITEVNEKAPVTKADAPDPALLTAADEKKAPVLSGQAATPNVIAAGTGKPVVVESPKATAENTTPKEVVGTSTDAFASGSIEDNLPAAVPVGDGQTIPEKMKEPAKDMFGASPVSEVKAESGKIAPEDAPKLTPVDGQGNSVAPVAPKPATSSKAPTKAPASKKTAAVKGTSTKEGGAKKTASRRKPGTAPKK